MTAKLASQAQGSKFKSSEPLSNPGVVVYWGTVDPRNSSASQSSWIDELQVQWDTVLKMWGGEAVRKDTWPLVFVCYVYMHACVHNCTHTWSPPHTPHRSWRPNTLGSSCSPFVSFLFPLPWLQGLRRQKPPEDPAASAPLLHALHTAIIQLMAYWIKQWFLWATSLWLSLSFPMANCSIQLPATPGPGPWGSWQAVPSGPWDCCSQMASPGQAGAGSQGDGEPLTPRAPLAPVSSCLMLVFLGTRKSSVITLHPFIGIYPSLILLAKYYGDFGLEKEQRQGSGGCARQSSYFTRGC